MIVILIMMCYHNWFHNLWYFMLIFSRLQWKPTQKKDLFPGNHMQIIDQADKWHQTFQCGLTSSLSDGQLLPFFCRIYLENQ